MNKLISIGKWYTFVILTIMAVGFLILGVASGEDALRIGFLMWFAATLPMALFIWHNNLKD